MGYILAAGIFAGVAVFLIWACSRTGRITNGDYVGIVLASVCVGAAVIFSLRAVTGA
jgi:general stress protein CsbA